MAADECIQNGDASDRRESGAPPAKPCGPDGPPMLLPCGWAFGSLRFCDWQELRSPETWNINTAISVGVEHIMKSWNGHNDAPAAPRRTPAGNRFLTAVFVSLVVIAGLDTVFPSLKHHFIPEPARQPQPGTDDASKPFEWSQVRVEHSRASAMRGRRTGYLPCIYI
jgi:hypothetical protein